jgi:plastocyanin
MSHSKITAPLATLGLAISLAAAMPQGPAAGETATPAAASAATVRIDNFNFTPPALFVAPGTTVSWTNDDDTPHNVREKDGKFKSAALDTDDTFSQTFSAPGEYEYFCSIHPRMVGKIVVKPGAKMSSK